jgi:hypothetical protein
MPAIIDPVPAPPAGEPKPPLQRRLTWFVLLSLGGVLATAIAAYGLRALLFWR